ncbi:MAG: ABC transporter ATP-binding protein [Methylocystaceae bacterium]|nr:ABC transporter ATP-binding protein [Methylocystaceae bacterium]
MSYLRVEGLSKYYDGVSAVEDITFEANKGEFVALLGPSGCGKSTTLMMLAGLEDPSRGKVYFADQDMTHTAPGKRGLSMVFQSYALFPHLNVRENILFGLKARKVPTNEQTNRLENVLELVDLKDHIDKKPGQLSGGQCQRVALARAIVSQAPICLMDEPLSNLDARLRNEMRTEIRALQKKLDLTVIYVTHDQIEAMSMADRVILLNNGRIEQNDTPDRLYNFPESAFSAGFIGHPPMNLIQQRETLLGIRPEDISLSLSSSQSVDGLSTTVIDCDYHGANTLIAVDFRGQTLRFIQQGHHTHRFGTPLTITWDREREHHFCLNTGRRLTNHSLSHSIIEGFS